MTKLELIVNSLGSPNSLGGKEYSVCENLLMTIIDKIDNDKFKNNFDTEESYKNAMHEIIELEFEFPIFDLLNLANPKTACIQDYIKMSTYSALQEMMDSFEGKI